MPKLVSDPELLECFSGECVGIVTVGAISYEACTPFNYQLGFVGKQIGRKQNCLSPGQAADPAHTLTECLIGTKDPICFDVLTKTCVIMGADESSMYVAR